MERGTHVLMLTDIVGSSGLWSADGEAAAEAVFQHHALVDAIAEEFEGRRPPDQGEGDSRFITFRTGSSALGAAAALHRRLAAADWPQAPITVRVGLHVGETIVEGDNHYGAAVGRCARIRGFASGGQTLVSDALQALAPELPANTALEPRGARLLRGFHRPEFLWELVRAEHVAPAVPGSSDSMPQARTSFIGRSDELARLVDTLRHSHLVTVVGPGGVGKTRIAMETAKLLAATMTVHFCPLSSLPSGSDEQAIRSHLWQALGADGSRGDGESLFAAIGNAETLVVVDNAEHVVDATASAVGSALEAAPGLRVLVTSREPLGLSGEHRVGLEPLPLPDPSAGLAQIATADAVRLFVARARAVDDTFELDERTAPAVAEICSRMDRLPLGIELAAAQSAVYGPPALLKLIKSSASALAGDERDRADRHRTMQAAVEWSVTLLPAELRDVFVQLGVFRGPLSVEAVAAVSGRADARAALVGLHRRSLLTRADHPVDVAFDMLDSVRRAASRQFEARGDRLEVVDRWARYHLALAERLAGATGGADEPEAADTAVFAKPDLVAAVGWMLGEDPEAAAAAFVGLVRLGVIRGTDPDAIAWAETLDRAVRKTDMEAAVALAHSTLLSHRGDYKAGQVAGRALAAARRHGQNDLADELVITLARQRGGFAVGVEIAPAELAQLQSAAERAYGPAGAAALACELHQPGALGVDEIRRLHATSTAGSSPRYVAVTGMSLARSLLDLGESAEGAAVLTSVEPAVKRVGDPALLSWLLALRGQLHARRGDWDMAETTWREAEDLASSAPTARRMDVRAWLSLLAIERNDFEQARQLAVGLGCGYLRDLRHLTAVQSLVPGFTIYQLSRSLLDAPLDLPHHRAVALAAQTTRLPADERELAGDLLRAAKRAGAASLAPMRDWAAFCDARLASLGESTESDGGDHVTDTEVALLHERVKTAFERNRPRLP